MKGSLTISRLTSNDPAHDNQIRIEVRDQVSGETFIHLSLSPHQFALALTGLADVDCEFELRTDHVGKRREVKEEVIPVPRMRRQLTNADLDPILEEFETDGWIARRSDIGNHHRIEYSNSIGAGMDGYRVTFTRFVEP